MATGDPIIVGGGISPGLPFTERHYTLIVEDDPATIAAGRLLQLVDAGESIVAPDVSGSLQSMRLGALVTAPAGAAGAVSVLIGDTIIWNAGAQTAVVVGVNIGPGDMSNSVILGVNIGNVNVNNVQIGASTSAGGGLAVIIGVAASAAGQSVAIGRNAACGGAGVAVGESSSAPTSNGVAMGRSVQAGSAAVAIGFLLNVGADSVVISNNVTNAGTGNVVVGHGASAGALSNTIVLGRRAVVFSANECAIGTNEDVGADMRTFRWGPNALAGYAGLTVLLPSAPAGIDQGAPNLVFRGGLPTGNAVGGEIQFETGVTAASGAGYQANALRFAVIPSAGGASQPTIRLENITTTPTGVAAGTLLNAPTAGDPTDWVPVLINGNVRYIPAWP